MRLRCLLLLLFLPVLVTGCGSHDPLWRMKAQLTLLQLQQQEAESVYPHDFLSVRATFDEAERLLTVDEQVEQADQRYLLAYQQGSVLKRELELYRIRLKEEALQKAIEERALREEEERARIEEEQRRRQEEAEALRQQKKTERPAERHQEPAPQPQQVAAYTVRRGETLPQIAAKPEIYNDAALWPLIYRANRDQIRDPYQLWPGQVLKIPRSFSRDEALDARRLAHRRRL